MNKRMRKIFGKFYIWWNNANMPQTSRPLGIFMKIISFNQLSRVWLFVTPWTAVHESSLCNNSQSLLKLMAIELVMPSNHLILCCPCPFSCLQSFLASRSFLRSQLFTSVNQSIGASASASKLAINIQDWFPLGLTAWISMQSKELSRVFSNTTVQKHHFFGAQLSLWSNSHILTWLLKKT